MDTVITVQVRYGTVQYCTVVKYLDIVPATRLFIVYCTVPYHTLLIGAEYIS
jgi:hypothetical protein